MRVRELLEIDNPIRVPRQRDLFAQTARRRRWRWHPKEKNPRYDPTGYYHVTPFLDRVLASGVLKSKSEVQRDFNAARERYLDQVVHTAEYDRLPPSERPDYLDQMSVEFTQGYGSPTGLGAGSDLASNATVSLTYSYERAKDIYHQFKFVGMLVAGRLKTSAIYDYITANFDYPFIEELSPVDRVLIDYGVPRRAVLDGEPAPHLDRITDPQRQYEFMQELERAILQDEGDTNDSIEDFDDEFINDDGTVALTSQTIGFTAPFSAMQNIRPDNVGIIQCVIRKGARVEHIGEEAEVRVKSADLAMIRYSRKIP